MESPIEFKIKLKEKYKSFLYQIKKLTFVKLESPEERVAWKTF